MANFSYLFLSNVEPDVSGAAKDAPMRFIATGRNQVPFAFKLLLSGGPKRVRSFRDSSRKSYYLVSPRDPGLARLRAFLDRVELPGSRSLIEETLDFFARPEHQMSYVVLDPLDIFLLGDEPHSQQLQALEDEIVRIDSMIDEQLARIHAPLPEMTLGSPTQPGFIARLFGAKVPPARTLPFPDPLYRLEQIGLRSWREDARDQFAPPG